LQHLVENNMLYYGWVSIVQGLLFVKFVALHIWDFMTAIHSDLQETLHGSKIVVLGGMGFIGYNLCSELLSKGAHLCIIDNCFNSTEKGFQGFEGSFEFVRESVLNSDIYHHFEDVDYIFHLACVQINHSAKDPELDLQVNALSTLRILERLRNGNFPRLKRFIYTSTTSIYGSPENLPIHENSRPEILNHYAASKLLAEQYVMLYHLSYDVPATVIRYSNVYGYGQTPRNPYCGVLGKFIDSALNNQPLVVFGDGEQTRDYTFIDDAVSATIRAAIHPKGLGDVFNIGTSVETSVNQLVRYISQEIPSVQVNHMPERDIDNIRRRALSISKISQKLGWVPKVTIQQGISMTIDWNRKALS